jgi:hypothetical protein
MLIFPNSSGHHGEENIFEWLLTFMFYALRLNQNP